MPMWPTPVLHLSQPQHPPAWIKMKLGTDRVSLIDDQLAITADTYTLPMIFYHYFLLIDVKGGKS